MAGGSSVSTGCSHREVSEVLHQTVAPASFVPSGCCAHHGQGPGAHSALRAQVCADAGEHPGCVPQDPDTQVQQLYGASHEGCHQGHGHHEQTGASLPAPLLTPLRTTLTLLPLQLKLPQIQKIMMEFERQAEIMDMKEEMMNDAIDDAMGDEDDEEERFAETRWEEGMGAWPSTGLTLVFLPQ